MFILGEKLGLKYEATIYLSLLAARSFYNIKQANMRTSNVGIRTMKLLSGKSRAVFGQGTWLIREISSKRNAELAALQRGLDLEEDERM